MNSAERLRATYNFKPVDHLFRREFYIWEEAIQRWLKEGMPADADRNKLFGFDEPGDVGVGMLGWCEPQLVPCFETKVLETGEDYEVVQDWAGRVVKCFKGRRHGFMPTYLKHAVTCDKDWHENVAPRLAPQTPARWEKFDETIARMKAADAQGTMIVQTCVGGYMYLRSMVGPEEVCLMFVDNPELIHKMMQTWLELADEVSARIQKHVEFDTLYFAEDICYNHGLLISPDMVREFIFPYYEQLLENITRRQKHKRVFLQIDTDGNCDTAVDLYQSIGMDVMTPFEVAAGNDVVQIGKKHPNLVILGGIDKRVMAAGKKAIDEHLDYILPYMAKRGGYVPTCDHGVPDNVSFENYMYYRRRIMELDH